MKPAAARIVFCLLASSLAFLPLYDSAAKDVVRPEEIRSKREVIYDKDTYDKLAKLWKDYYKEFPSEYAYSNWMYAARYAQWEDYEKLLEKGLKKYPSNPKLLYLSGCTPGSDAAWAQARENLERAVAIDPSYMDPWFMLVTTYMRTNDEERTDVALRRLLESGIVQDCIMDYNYNTLIGLDSNAVLITNGDNDTYPGWILTRILKIRPDVSIINRSLLNTDWYPLQVMRHGAPQFISPAELTTLRDTLIARIRKGQIKMGEGGPYGDTLIVRIIEAAQRAERPVYFAVTLARTQALSRFWDNGQILGLTYRVTPSSQPADQSVRRLDALWLSKFRSAGLDSWKLRAAPASDAARMMMPNYAGTLVNSLDALRVGQPDLRAGLFRWYLDHVEVYLSDQMKSGIAQQWCKQDDVPEIRAWCEARGESH
jgi:hypothetical protein